MAAHRQTRQWAREHPPLGSRFQDTCRQTRSGGGLPEGSIIPAGITHDLVLQFDLPARRMEREERLLAFNGGDVNKTLWQICTKGGPKDARFLLAHGADANYDGVDGAPALCCAIRNGHPAVAAALLDSGAGEIGRALLCAAYGGRSASVALLLDRGANVHLDNDDPLYGAVFYGHLETATLLLQRGASATNRHLTVAVERGHHAVADLLRAHGAV